MLYVSTVVAVCVCACVGSLKCVIRASVILRFLHTSLLYLKIQIMQEATQANIYSCSGSDWFDMSIDSFDISTPKLPHYQQGATDLPQQVFALKKTW